jgi:flagellar FliJ protein
MPRFRFRLEKVLGLRARAERDAARDLAVLLSRREHCRRRLGELDRERHGLLLRRARLQQGRVEPAQLGQNHYQLVVLARAIEAWRGRAASMEEEIRGARERLREKRREKKLLEKLKEKRRASFEEEERRRERRELDAMPAGTRGMAIAMSQRTPDRG